MKSKEEILDTYYTKGADGMPEIAVDGLLKAMDEYRQQAEEQAFKAARELQGTIYTYPTFADYLTNHEKPVKPKNDLTANIRLIADSILPQFLPEDARSTQLSFNVKTNGKTYMANYLKDDQGYWVFQHYKEYI